MTYIASIKNYLTDITYILGNKNKSKIFKFISFFLILSLLDFLSFSLVAPFFSTILNSDSSIGIITNFKLFFSIELIGILILVVFILRFISAVFINYLIISFSQKIRLELTTNLITTYYKKSNDNLNQQYTSHYINIMTEVIKHYCNSLIILLRLSSDFIVFFFIFIFLLNVNTPMTLLISFIAISLIIIFDLIFKRRLTKTGKKINILNSKLINYISEGIEGYKEIKILQKDNFIINSIKETVSKYTKLIIYRDTITIIPRYAFELIFLSLAILFLFYINFDQSKLINSIPLLSIFFLAAIRLLPMSGTLSSSIVKLRSVRNSILLLNKELKSTQNNLLKIKSVKQTEVKEFKSIEFKNICLDYKHHKILNNLNLKIIKGDKVGITGVSGAGKTSLINIITGFIKPTSGIILVNDDHSFENVLDSIRSKISYLPQKSFIINDSIIKNISLELNDYDVDEEKISKSMISAFTDNQFNKNDIISEKGLNISGGQSQKISLARSYYFDKEIIILDEATNSLDQVVEKKIINNILNKTKKTVIIISHNRDNLKNCNKIINLEKQ